MGGFFVYDLIFIPPYGTLDVGAAENWVALVVYVVVMLLVAQVVVPPRCGPRPRPTAGRPRSDASSS